VDSRGTIVPGRLNTAQPALRGLLLPKYENNPIHYLSSLNSGKSIDDLAALVELDIKVAVFDPVFFVVLNKPRNRVKILYWECNGFCLCSNALNPNVSKHRPIYTDEAIVLTARELNWRLNGFDLWRNRTHQVSTLRFVA